MTSNRDTFVKGVDRYLFHYARPSAFNGIFATRSLYASHIAFLNDSSEFRFTFNCAASTIRRLRKELCPESLLADADQIVKIKDDVLQRTLNLITSNMEFIPLASGTFVTCFSTKFDDLSQWRAYCPQGGFAIGFHKEDLESMQHVTLGPRKVILMPCIYVNEFDDKVPEVEGLLRDPDRWREDDEAHHPTADEIFKHIESSAPTIKSDAFKEEDEWRLIVTHLIQAHYDRIEFTASPEMLRPHIPLALPENFRHSLKIVIGPSSHQSLLATSAKHVAKKYHLRFEYMQSPIPFRYFS